MQNWIEDGYAISRLEQYLEEKDKEIKDLKSKLAKAEETMKLMDHFFMMVGKHRLTLERTLIHNGIALPTYFVKED